MRIRSLSLLLIALSLIWCAGAIKPGATDAGILRLHVIANSDSPADQAAKLQVRDAILRYEAGRLDTASAASVRAGILEDGAGLLAAVEDSLQRSGMNYSARLALGRYAFPERTYGGKVYPAGEYQALRVVLGQGAGQNWWCVLFPPLCILELPDGEIEDNEAMETMEGIEMESLILKLLKEGKIKDDSDG